MRDTQKSGKMNQVESRICVYYDGACPQCARDRRNYERLSGRARDDIQWIDITGQEALLRSMGIDPQKALLELHVKNENQEILSEINRVERRLRRSGRL